MHRDIWSYREMVPLPDKGISGFAVDAIDGSIGYVDEASEKAGEGYIVVDTGPWIFGKRIAIPVGAIDNVDLIDERVYLEMTREQVKKAPEIKPDTHVDEALRGELTDYYEPIFHGRMEM